MLDETSIDIYSSRDQIRNQLITLAQSYLDLQNTDLSKTNYLSYLINIMSMLTSNLMYYSTSIYKEFFLTKAVQKSSVLNLASMLGYTPPYAVPSKGQVMIELPLTFSDDVTFHLKQGTHYSAGDIVFSQDNDVQVHVTIDHSTGVNLGIVVTETLPTGGNRTLFTTYDSPLRQKAYFMVDVTQEETNIITFQIPSTLQPYEFFEQDVVITGQISNIYKVAIKKSFSGETVNDLINEISAGDEWTGFSSLFLIPTETKGYTFRQTETGGQVFFGNGIVGYAPTPNYTCLMLINTTQGSKGNVLAGLVTSADRIYVQDGVNAQTGNPIFRTVEMRVINTSPMSGGADTETIDQTRANAIAQISSLHRLVSEFDYGKLRLIDPNLPIRHSKQILKRSDIKNSEIFVYTDIIFNNLIVPTRNESWDVGTNEHTSLTIYGLNDTITINGTEYYSMFNIVVDPTYKDCQYYYYLKNVQSTVTISNYMSGDTQIVPISVSFSVTPDLGTPTSLLVELSYQEVSNPLALNNLTCSLKTAWGPDSYPMTIDALNKKFTASLPFSSLPEGELSFVFYNYGINSNSQTVQICESISSVIVKQNLDDFMYSQIKDVVPNGTTYMGAWNANTNTPALTSGEGTEGYYYKVSAAGSTTLDGISSWEVDDWVVFTDETWTNDPGGIYRVFDVPLIRKDYYDDIDKNSFILNFYDKVLTFDTTSYRMVTDFVNLKFANTTGMNDNMKFNKPTKNSVILINPTLDDIITPTDGDRYIVTGDQYSYSGGNNPWFGSPWNQEPGFIAEYVALSFQWVFTKLDINDVIVITSLSNQKYVYNGTQMVLPIFSIPCQINLTVWKDTKQSYSSQTIVQNVKDALINNFYRLFGFERNIYLSQIMNTVQSVPGVLYCKITDPQFDIFYNFDYQHDLTQEQLLAFSPQLVSFDTTTINVEVR